MIGRSPPRNQSQQQLLNQRLDLTDEEMREQFDDFQMNQQPDPTLELQQPEPPRQPLANGPQALGLGRGQNNHTLPPAGLGRGQNGGSQSNERRPGRPSYDSFSAGRGFSPPGQGHPRQLPSETETVARCTLPPFWHQTPVLWFAHAEATFDGQGLWSDHHRYSLVVAKLPAEVTQEVSDVILRPPPTDKYPTLKAAVLQRLSASPEHQLHQLLNEVRLEGRTPSQLLRYMRRLAGTAISDEALKVKWMDLLPPFASKMCRVLPSSSLDELGDLADLLVTPEPAVQAVGRRSSPGRAPPASVAHNELPPSALQELSALRSSVTQLLAMLQVQTNLLQSVVSALPQGAQRQSRGRSRSQSRPPPRSPTPGAGATNAICWYHRKFGQQAAQCKPPCSFPAQSGN